MTHKDSSLSKLKKTPHNKAWALKDALNHVESSMNSVTLLANQAPKKCRPFKSHERRNQGTRTCLVSCEVYWQVGIFEILLPKPEWLQSKQRMPIHHKISLFWDITYTEFFNHTLHIHFMYYTLLPKPEISLLFRNVFLKQAMNGKKTSIPLDI